MVKRQPRRQQNFRLAPDTVKLLSKMAKKLNLDKTSIVERAIVQFLSVKENV